MAQSNPNNGRVLRNLLIVLVGQVGCLTLVVVLALLWLGLWLDAYFKTPWRMFTVGLLVAGIPISIWLMLWVARRTIARLEDGSGSRSQDSPSVEV